MLTWKFEQMILFGAPFSRISRARWKFPRISWRRPRLSYVAKVSKLSSAKLGIQQSSAFLFLSFLMFPFYAVVQDLSSENHLDYLYTATLSKKK